MTNRLAILLGGLLLAALGLDLALADGAGALFLGRRLFTLLDAIAVWR